MQYRKDKQGNAISVLGFGCMRFTRKGTGFDVDKAEQEILAAFHSGVNYYDTAYVYPGSEALIGEIFERNGIRNQVRITTKLPHYMLKKPSDMDRFFEEELKRLRTDHVEVYLMHMLNDVKSWERLTELGVPQWLEEKKASGQIGQVGFSYHGNSDMFCKVLDAYDWDICQIQYNYMDEHSQAGRTGLQYAAARGIPVVIMEPLRGGRLVNHLPKEAQKLFAESPIKRTPACWALHWLWDQPEVTCVLSGMNSLEMVKENVASAEETRVGILTGEDRLLLHQVSEAINAGMKVGCTGCRYCMPCPQGVDIPGTFAAYNRSYTDGLFYGIKDYFMCTSLRKDASDASRCIGCGKCEQHCPQNIAIRSELQAAHRRLGGVPLKAARLVAGTYMKY